MNTRLHPMRILVVTDYMPTRIAGGAEVSTHLVLRELAKRKHEIHVLVNKLDEQCIEEKAESMRVYETRITFDHFSLPKPLSYFYDVFSFIMSFCKTLYYLKTTKPHAVITHQVAGYGAVIASKLIGTPVVYVVRGYQTSCFNRSRICIKADGRTERCDVYKCDFRHLRDCILASTSFPKIIVIPYIFYAYLALKLREYAVSMADAVVAISNFIRKMLEYQYPNEKIIVTIYNPVDQNSCKPRDAKERELAFVYAGRLSQEKGVDTLLKAFGRLAKEYSSCKMFICGDGPQKGHLELITRRLDLNENVVFFGYRPHQEVLEIMRSSYAVVVPSLWDEPLGRAVIEALSVGTPVIASRVGGIKELIIYGVNGLLTEPGDVKDLYRAMKELLENEKLYRKMMQIHVDTKFSVEEVVTRYENLLHRMLRKYRLEAD